jgi:hypothetical protein
MRIRVFPATLLALLVVPGLMTTSSKAEEPQVDPRADLRAEEGARCHPQRHQAGEEAGRHQGLEGSLGRGTATLYINGKAMGSTKVAQTEFSIFSADETAGVGIDTETPVSDEYNRASSKFTGKINKVTINLK